METGLGMDLNQLRKLIKSIEHHELQINIDGKIFIYDPVEHGEKPDAPEETEPEIEKQRAPTPEEIEAMNLEAEEIPEAIEILGLEESPEALDDLEVSSEEEDVVIIE